MSPDIEISEDEEYVYTPSGTTQSVYDMWHNFAYVLNDLQYISSELFTSLAGVGDSRRGFKFEVAADGTIAVLPTTIGPGPDLDIYEEKLNRSKEILEQLNAELTEWAKRTGLPRPDLSWLDEEFTPMKMNLHTLAHGGMWKFSWDKFQEWKERYRAQYDDGIFVSDLTPKRAFRRDLSRPEVRVRGHRRRA